MPDNAPSFVPQRGKPALTLFPEDPVQSFKKGVNREMTL